MASARSGRGLIVPSLDRSYRTSGESGVIFLYENRGESGKVGAVSDWSHWRLRTLTELAMSTTPETNRTTHTAGEWKLAGREVLGQSFVGTWCLICKVSGGSPQAADANARLIATAPELLTALRDLVAVIQTDDLLPPHLSYMKQATDVLAKAEGK